MKKITLSLDVIAAIIAVTILQACANTAGTQCVCEKPTLTPASGPAAIVIIKTATMGASLRYTLNGSTPTGGTSGHGTPIAAQSGSVPGPLVFGRTLKAIAYKAGCSDSLIAVGKY
ncbi:MAG: hypothetical protein DME64_08275 [Verrucomicrobia bacterium]|jgi:hypothetical protein|nr:MAG: hypothetical protein DME64_08275 [Verrucomicrobiota bacterium]